MFIFKIIIFIGCIISVFPAVRNVMEESEIDNTFLENNVVYGIISELTNSNINITSMCASNLTNVLRGINKQDMWAVKVMDASGTYQSSFVWGQNAWLGSERQCDFLNIPPKFTVSPDLPKLMDAHLISTVAPMEMNYKMIFLIIHSPYKVDPIHFLRTTNTHRLGVCLPKACSNEEIELLSKSFFAQRKFKFQKLYNASIEVIQVRDMDIKNFLSRPEVSRIFFTICFVTALVIVFSFANKYMEHTNMDELKRFFKCFSIHDNVAAMYDTSSSPNAVNSVNGLRSIICLWVLFNHCSYYAIYAYDNLPMLMAALERLEIQPFFVILFYVDIFFVLSALLLVFNFLKDERTLNEVRKSTYTENMKLFLKKIIHRYIRLTPAFLFSIGISHILAIYIQESSSYYVDETFEGYCTKKGWWGSVFYIHNLFPVDDMCTSWSWYLACDMQFYIIILFILFIYAKSPTFAIGLFMTLFASISAIGIYSNIEINLLPRMDSIFYHVSEFYFGMERMHPYLAGATVGYVFFRIKDKKFKKNSFAVTLYWIAAIPTILASLFVTALKDSSNLSFALTLSFGRYIMGLCVGSSIFMCHFGYGGIVNKIMSSRFFVHINKTTYVIYLVHPVIVMYFYSNKEYSPHFDVPSVATMMGGVALFSYTAAIFIAPIFEIPFQKLSDEYVMKKSRTKI